MIAHLIGTLSHKSPDHCVVDVNGVGYSVMVSLSTFASLPEVGAKSRLSIYTHVREDQFLLYGFATDDEKTLFCRLIQISGVGPKTALSILSGLPTDHLVDAIANEDHARLSSIPGVGKKTAERIIVDLKDRITKIPLTSGVRTPAHKAGLYDDALSALTNLGYQRVVAENALKKTNWSESMQIEEVIRLALRELSRA